MSKIEEGWLSRFANIARVKLVKRKQPASIVVVRVKRFAVPRADITPPMVPPPIPKPPPSLRWIKIMTMMDTVMRRWIASMVVCMF